MKAKKCIPLLLSLLLAAAPLYGCAKQSEEVVEISLPSGAQEMPEGMGEMPSGEMPSGEMPSGMGQMPSGMGQMPSGSGSAKGGSGGARGGSSGTSEGGSPAQSALSMGENDVLGRVESIVGNRATLLLGTSENGSITYGEETAAYLLPVGMSIGTGDFSSVTAGMVLKLSIEMLEDGSENITAVSIVSR